MLPNQIPRPVIKRNSVERVMLSHMLQVNQSTGRWRRPGRRLRPRSITGLLMGGFGLVALPLIVAILLGVNYVDRLNNQSERLVLQGVHMTRYSKRLSDTLTAMERTARQYRVLHKDELIARFHKQTARLDDLLKKLGSLQIETVSITSLEALRQQASRLSSAMAKRPKRMDGIIQTLNAMERDADHISRKGGLFVDQELSRLQSTASKARNFLILCVFAVIPVALALIVFFTAVIARPLRQITLAITRLGNADFSTSIRVQAPAKELDTLGSQLDWMRQRLATLEHEKQQFLRRMSHELKTPLASIREGAELLEDGTVGKLNATQRRVVQLLQQNGHDLTGLIENLLNFSSWQQHHARLEFERFDIAALIEKVVTRQKLTIDKRQLDIILPDKGTFFDADTDRMHVIIDNLLANAIKFSPRGAMIRLTAEQNRNASILHIADEGPGVAENERAVIFDAFYQGHASVHGDTGVRGTGIGLSVVQECVAAHGGTIEIGAASGGGALFSIKIPRSHAHDRAHE